MDESRAAALANMAAYNSDFVKEYVAGVPHLKHSELRMLYGRLLVRVLDFAREHNENLRVLDIGAGEGTSAALFLELGAHVTAVDLSSSQLEQLRARCARFGDRLDVHCSEIDSFLESTQDQYDIIVASSFLHHIPDYIDLIRKALPRLSPSGQFFSFQDPLRYDSLGSFTLLYTRVAYFFWRVFRGDALGGMRRYLRRRRGVYLRDSVADNAEYHVVRNGVDQDAVLAFFKEQGFECELIRYFSTQSSLFQPVGSSLGLKNMFAVIARRQPTPA